MKFFWVFRCSVVEENGDYFMIEVEWNKPFYEQLEYFGSKGIVLSPESWKDVWQGAHARAFTVAQVTKADVLVDIQGALKEAMASGTTLKEFKKGLQGTLEGKGWLAPKGERAKMRLPDGTVRKRLTGWRLNTIYQVNCNIAASVGRHKQMMDPDVLKARPFLRYVGSGSAEPNTDHMEWYNTVLPADDPWWDTHYPPNDWGCK